MASKITKKEFERLYLSAGCEGLVDLHADHVTRTAEILSEKFPGIVFLWYGGGKSIEWRICGVRPDCRKMSGKLAGELVAAAEMIAANVARKHGRRIVRRTKLRPGWQFTEDKKLPKQSWRSKPTLTVRGCLSSILGIVLLAIAAFGALAWWVSRR